MDKCKCKKCGKIITLNRLETCKECLQVERICRCGLRFLGSPKTDACPVCNKAMVAKSLAKRKSA